MPMHLKSAVADLDWRDILAVMASDDRSLLGLRISMAYCLLDLLDSEKRDDWARADAKILREKYAEEAERRNTLTGQLTLVAGES